MHQLSDYAGRWLVIHFYPSADTPLCTCDATDYTLILEDLPTLNVPVLCINDDTPGNHDFYSIKYELDLTILSDMEREVMRRYAAWTDETRYGREKGSVLRSTFLIDPDGLIARWWKDVPAAGHVEGIRAAILERTQ